MLKSLHKPLSRGAERQSENRLPRNFTFGTGYASPRKFDKGKERKNLNLKEGKKIKKRRTRYMTRGRTKLFGKMTL